MRILFSACPMYGHVNTVLPMALAARAAGHDVAVATGADLVPHVERRGVAGWAVGPTHREAGGGPDTNWLEYFDVSARGRAADLVPRAVAWRPDLVVSEDTELSGAVVAAATGARHVVQGVGLMPPMRIWDWFAPTIDRLFGASGVAGTAEQVRAATYLELCPPSLRPAGERIWADAWPVRPTGGAAAPGERLPFDELPYPDTVHLTLGTVFHGNQPVLAAALAGLAELPVNVVATVGPDVDPAGFGPRPPHVLVAPYLPHALLLPRCRAVVSQAGAGVMFAALAHGLPQLLLPQGAEQFGNAEACRDAGAALVLRPDEVTPAAVAAAVARLLGEPSFTAAAGRIRAELDAMPTVDVVLERLLA